MCTLLITMSCYAPCYAVLCVLLFCAICHAVRCAMLRHVLLCYAMFSAERGRGVHASRAAGGGGRAVRGKSRPPGRPAGGMEGQVRRPAPEVLAGDRGVSPRRRQHRKVMFHRPCRIVSYRIVFCREQQHHIPSSGFAVSFTPCTRPPRLILSTRKSARQPAPVFVLYAIAGVSSVSVRAQRGGARRSPAGAARAPGMPWSAPSIPEGAGELPLLPRLLSRRRRRLRRRVVGADRRIWRTDGPVRYRGPLPAKQRVRFRRRVFVFGSAAVWMTASPCYPRGQCHYEDTPKVALFPLGEGIVCLVKARPMGGKIKSPRNDFVSHQTLDEGGILPVGEGAGAKKTAHMRTIKRWASLRTSVRGE